MIKLGLDVGSTTVKMVAVDKEGRIIYSKYERHNAKAKDVIILMLKELGTIVNNEDIAIRITGSVGMGLSEKLPSDLNCLVLKTQRNYKMASLLIYPSLQYLLFPLILISCTALFALNRLYIYIILDLDECILLFVTSDFL